MVRHIFPATSDFLTIINEETSAKREALSGEGVASGGNEKESVKATITRW